MDFPFKPRIDPHKQIKQQCLLSSLCYICFEIGWLAGTDIANGA